MRDGFVDEGSQCRAFDVLNDPGDDMAFAAEGPDDDRLAFLIALSGPLIPMPIAATAADNRFVNLDDPRKLANVLDHRGSDLVAHEPSGLVRAETHIAEDLKGGLTPKRPNRVCHRAMVTRVTAGVNCLSADNFGSGAYQLVEMYWVSMNSSMPS
jgi:hypothetical protein